MILSTPLRAAPIDNLALRTPYEVITPTTCADPTDFGTMETGTIAVRAAEEPRSLVTPGTSRSWRHGASAGIDERKT